MSGILTAIPVIGKVLDKGLGIIDKFVEDKDQANRLKAEIKQQIESQTHEAEIAELRAQAGLVGAEIRGESWLQRNWRPMLMLTVILIIFNNYVLFPYLSLFTDKARMLDLPKGLWALLNIGVGGYVAGRSGEKIVRKLRK